MKKFLALVLALVMTMSLVTIAGAEDYTDADSMNYAEAVEVMSAVGVVGGYADGSFNPQAGLTRGAAAKIICNMILGPTTAEALVANDAPFSDVAADNVFAGYIAYCANEGIISGYADGTFKPAAPLTGYAFMKMLLGALGYDAAIEGYVGSNWSIQVAKRALNIELDKGLVGDFSGAKALTREEACLYAFNALQTEMVYYPGNTSIVVGDVKVTTSAAATGTTELFMDKYFTDLELDQNTKADDFGRPANLWIYDDEEVGTFTKTPDAVFTAQMKEKDMFTEIGAAGKAGTYAKFIEMTKIFKDGNEVTNDAAYADSKVIAKGDKSLVAGTGNGVTVEVYKTAANEYTMVCINEYVSTVKSIVKANEAKETERAVTVMGVNGSIETEDYKKGDTVLYTQAKGVIKSIATPETISGEVTKITNNNTYTIDGVDYVLSQDNASVSITLGAEGTWYVDSCGNIIKTKEATDADVYYGYLLQYNNQKASASSDDLFETTAKVNGEKFKFVNAEGQIVVLDGAIKTNSDGKVTHFVAAAGEVNDANGNKDDLSGLANDWTSAKKNVLFGYELNADGKITKVYEANDSRGYTCTLTKGVAKPAVTEHASNLAMTKDTVVFYVDNTDEEYVAYVGYANLATKTGTEIGRIFDGNANVMQAVVLSVSDVATESAKNYVYFAGTDKTAESTEDGTVVTYTNVYLNGVEGELEFDSTQSVTAGDVYEYTVNSKTGMATLGTKRVDATNVVGNELTVVEDTYFKYGTTVAYTDADTIFYEIDTDAETMTVVEGLPALAENDEYSVNVLYYDKGSDKDTGADTVIFFVGD
jgi:hypothetical protein